MFQGFQPEAVDFLWGLRLHNERPWFQAHKEEFRALVDTPFRELASQIYKALDQEHPSLSLFLRVSRIYRDARRLFGREPYRDRLWFSLRRPLEDASSDPCFYFELAPEQFSYGLGFWDPSPRTMARLRARIDRDPAPLERMARQLDKQDDFQLLGETYKRAKGDPGPLLFRWYNARQLDICCARNCEGILFSPDLPEELLKGYRFLMPLYLFFLEAAAEPLPEKP